MATVSLTNYDAQLAAAQRRQKLAEMLQEQSAAPIEIQSYRGIQAPIPFTAVLAKALQGGLAGYQGKKADEQKAALGEQTRKGLAEYLQQSSPNYQIPNIQASPPMRTEQVQGPMAQPVGLQTPQQLTAGGMQGMAARGNAPMAMPPTSAMAPPVSAPVRPQTISVPDMTPQPAMINRPAVDRQQMVLQGIASDNPLIRQVAPSMYDQATKDVDRETMVNAIKKIKVEGTDAEMLGAYMASPDPSKALDYLVSVGNSRAEAAAKLDAVKLKIEEDVAAEQRRREFSAEQNDLNRQLQLFGINEGSRNRAADRANTLITSGATNQRQLVAAGTTMRREFNNLPEVKTFRDVNTSYKNIQNSAKAETPASDMALIFSYMKLLDPNSVVREGEYATAANATNIPGRIVTMYNKAVKGTGLNANQRKDFVNQAGSRFKVAEQRYGQIGKQYSSYATDMGIDPSYVVGFEPTSSGGWSDAKVVQP